MAIPKKELHENDIQHNPAHNTGEAVFIDCVVYSAFEEMPTTVKIFVLFNYMTIYFCRQLTGQTGGIFPCTNGKKLPNVSIPNPYGHTQMDAGMEKKGKKTPSRLKAFFMM